MAVSGQATAATPDDDGEEPVSPRGWEYGLMVGFGVHNQGLDGAAFSLDVPEAIRTDSAQAPGDSATTPFLSVTTSVFFPEDLLGTSDFAPRLVFDLGADFQLDNAFRASAYNFDFDVLDGGGTVGQYCPQPGVKTCSYEARVRVDVLANWYAGVGFDFTLPVAERRYHVTPGFGYFGEAYESEGLFSLSGSDNLASDDENSISSTSDAEVLHGLYGRLGLGVDVWETGAFTSRLSINGRAAYILSDRETTYSGSNPNPPDDFTFDQANFMARPSSWVFTVYAGVEVRFDPSRW
jgi:hypothetical protein